MISPSKHDFKTLASSFNIIPVCREILADLETPVSAFLKLKGDKVAYLLESVEGGERIARFSFIGISPRTILSFSHGILEKEERGVNVQIETDDPFAFLRDYFARFRVAPSEVTSRFFGGAVGYLSYDMVRYIENIPDTNPDRLNVPDFIFVITDIVLIFDHIQHKIKVVCPALVDEKPEHAYDVAVASINTTIQKLHRSLPTELYKLDFKKQASTQCRGNAPFSSNMTKNEFVEKVNKAKEYIKAGDVIQVVLSQCLHTKINADPFNIYRALRTINPSPYMYFLSFEHFDIIGASPELLVRVENGIIEERPIAGTRKRGKNEVEDTVLQEELLADPKERAEHVMLVDLGRNDIGRVCEYGSVEVKEFMVVEKYSHVMHIVSDVLGRMRKDVDIYDVLKATFPAGTVSGAPKVRAMEIIDELETTKRGPYAGAICYIGFSGNFDSCITIRTVVVKDKIAYVQVGAGIVADSNPLSEHQETLNKAYALIDGIMLAKGEL